MQIELEYEDLGDLLYALEQAEMTKKPIYKKLLELLKKDFYESRSKKNALTHKDA